MPSRGGHPRHADRLRHFLVRYGPLRLTAIFVLLLAAVAALLALGLTIDSGEWSSFPGLWRDEGMALLGLSIKAPDANTGSAFSQTIRTLQGLLGLILLAIYTAVIVFRLFIHPQVFVFRQKITVQPAPRTFKGELPEDGHVLAIRLYNASPMRALDVEFSVIHQRWFGADRNAVVRNVRLPLANAGWPMADRPVPYALFVKLKQGDVVEGGDGGLRLATIQGEAINANDRLVVHVCGSMPDVGETFVERHAFDLATAVTDKPYGGISLDYYEDPKTWDGWGDFDA
ncbi:MAG TPA: hypothetical protein VEW07_07465 [Solirubrobacterales bacterium]|nr:hypothetical protein [Solirubrobacterales bacterium]